MEVRLGHGVAHFGGGGALVGEFGEVRPVVKADAYRHGEVAVSHALEAEGAGWLAVSSVEEGCLLRQSGIQSRILVMADFLEDERDKLASMHSEALLAEDLDVAKTLADAIQAHLGVLS